MASKACVTFALSLLACLAVAGTARAGHLDRLLAPESVCRGQSDTTLPAYRQVRIMLCMHRYARKRAGRPAGIRMVRRLRRSARAKAADIRRCQVFTHAACGRDAFYWFRRVGFLRGCYSAAENISLGSSYRGSVRDTMSGWLRSRPHRRTLLSRTYGKIGFGMVRGQFRGYDEVEFWVAHFGHRC